MLTRCLNKDGIDCFSITLLVIVASVQQKSLKWRKKKQIPQYLLKTLFYCTVDRFSCRDDQMCQRKVCNTSGLKKNNNKQEVSLYHLLDHNGDILVQVAAVELHQINKNVEKVRSETNVHPKEDKTCWKTKKNKTNKKQNKKTQRKEKNYEFKRWFISLKTVVQVAHNRILITHLSPPTEQSALRYAGLVFLFLIKIIICVRHINSNSVMKETPKHVTVNTESVYEKRNSDHKQKLTTAETKQRQTTWREHSRARLIWDYWGTCWYYEKQ